MSQHALPPSQHLTAVPATRVATAPAPMAPPAPSASPLFRRLESALASRESKVRARVEVLSQLLQRYLEYAIEDGLAALEAKLAEEPAPEPQAAEVALELWEAVQKLPEIAALNGNPNPQRSTPANTTTAIVPVHVPAVRAADPPANDHPLAAPVVAPAAPPLTPMECLKQALTTKQLAIVYHAEGKKVAMPESLELARRFVFLPSPKGYASPSSPFIEDVVRRIQVTKQFGALIVFESAMSLKALESITTACVNAGIPYQRVAGSINLNQLELAIQRVAEDSI